MDLINEINKIRDFMGLNSLNENQLINEAVPPGLKKIIDDIIVGSKGPVKREIESTIKPALNKFLSVGDVDKFVLDSKNASILQDWLKSTNGVNFKQALKEKILSEPDTVKQMSYNAYLKGLDDLETSVILDIIPKPKTPKVNDEIILDVPNISNSAKTNAMKLGINADEMFNEINNSLPKEISRAEKLKLDFVEELNNLNIEKGKESLRFSKEINELNLLEKEVKVKTSILDKEYKSLKNKELDGRITDAERLRKIEIKKKLTDLRRSQFKIYSRIIGYTSLGIIAIMGLNYSRKLFCEKMPEGFCEWFILKGGKSTNNKKTYQGIDDKGNPIFK
jgi:hypothetical protein